MLIGLGIGVLELGLIALAVLLVALGVWRIARPHASGSAMSSQALGAVILGLISIAPFAYCASQGGCRLLGDSSPTNDDEGRRVEKDAEESDEIRRLQGLLCTAEMDLFADEVALRIEGHIAYVRPEALAQMDVDERTVFAGWVGVCRTRDGKAILRDGQTGETFALWGVGMGYSPQ